jgi:hypothetical protein
LVSNLFNYENVYERTKEMIRTFILALMLTTPMAFAEPQGADKPQGEGYGQGGRAAADKDRGNAGVTGRDRADSASGGQAGGDKAK